MRVFMDFEMTGLHQHTTPISIGLKSADGHYLYAEYTDYDLNQLDDWVQEHVVDQLVFKDNDDFTQNLGVYTYIKGPSDVIAVQVCKWLLQFDKVEMWGDCLGYDAVLFNEIFGGSLNLPKHVDYIFYDICTLFKMFGIDPDISREAFIDRPIKGVKHTALYDAEVIEACYDKLVRNKDLYPFSL